jgi:putative membrane protein
VFLAADPILLGLGGALYARGVIKLWPRAGGRGLRIGHVLTFTAGWSVLVLALLSPLHDLAHELFWAHMMQHMLLMAVAAPLLVAARPWPVLLFGLPCRLRRHAGRLVPSRILARPGLVFMAHALVLWIWHVPPLYDAAVAVPALHWLEHLSMLTAAILFWHLVLMRLPRYREGCGAAVLLLLATSMHAGLLGALLTFAPEPLYASHLGSAPLRGLDPLEDQQLAGLIMWVPACAVYLVAGLALVGVWLRRLERMAPAEAPR